MGPMCGLKLLCFFTRNAALEPSLAVVLVLCQMLSPSLFCILGPSLCVSAERLSRFTLKALFTVFLLTHTSLYPAKFHTTNPIALTAHSPVNSLFAKTDLVSVKGKEPWVSGFMYIDLSRGALPVYEAEQDIDGSPRRTKNIFRVPSGRFLDVAIRLLQRQINH